MYTYTHTYDLCDRTIALCYLRISPLTNSTVLSFHVHRNLNIIHSNRIKISKCSIRHKIDRSIDMESCCYHFWRILSPYVHPYIHTYIYNVYVLNSQRVIQRPLSFYRCTTENCCALLFFFPFYRLCTFHASMRYRSSLQLEIVIYNGAHFRFFAAILQLVRYYMYTYMYRYYVHMYVYKYVYN